jgi:chromosome segregation ATPase
LDNLNKFSVNQPILYRHNHPNKRLGGQILGRVIETKIADVKDATGKLVKGIIGKAFIKNKTKFQQQIQEYIRKKDQLKDPIKISIGFENQELDAEVYEYSLTYKPVCEECSTMVTEQEKTEAQMGELQTALDKSAGIVKEFEKKTKELESKVAEYEKTASDKDKKLKEFEDKLISMKDLSTKISELEKKLSDAEKAPLIDQIYELEQDDELKEIYKGWEMPRLVKRLEKVRTLRPQIATEPLYKSREKYTDEDSKVKENMSKMDFSKLDPLVAKTIKELN